MLKDGYFLDQELEVRGISAITAIRFFGEIIELLEYQHPTGHFQSHDF